MILIHSNSNSPTYNLALEELLFSQTENDFVLFYVNAPSVILGSNQAYRNEVNREFCSANRVSVVRRKSGGGAVYHDLGNLNFSFIRTSSQTNSLINAEFLQPVVAWLAKLGMEASIGERKDLWSADGYKISGTASLVRKNRVLQHGTLLFDTDQQMLSNALAVKDPDMTLKATASVRSRTKNIRAYLEDREKVTVGMADFVNAIVHAATQYYGCRTLTEMDFDQERIALLEAHYHHSEWTYKK